MSHKKNYFTLPENFTSYLLYADDSGLNEEEVKTIDRFMKRHSWPRIIGAEEQIEALPHNDLNSLYCETRKFYFISKNSAQVKPDSSRKYYYE